MARGDKENVGKSPEYVCYCCGEKLGKVFCLVTMQPDQADRVFLMSVEHSVKADYSTFLTVEVKP